jgi:hypothetical protein
MGDPETVVIPRLKTDLVELFLAVANEKLDEITLEIDERSATTVMLYLVATLKILKRKSYFWIKISPIQLFFMQEQSYTKCY